MSLADKHITSSAAFFEEKYRKKADPWDFAADTYELSRYDAIIAAIRHKRYHSCYEPGCSIGVLTERLAAHCDAVLAVDFSPSASAQARTRCSYLPNVEVRCASLLDEFSLLSFDLLMLSEIGYYFMLEEWRQVSLRLVDSLPAHATILAAHWLGSSDDHRISGDQVHEILLSHPGLHLEHQERHAAMRLDRLVRL